MIDVCLLLEGTYPYVAGGVSTWVHQLVTAMKDIRFGIVYITPHSDPTRTAKYKIPDNVIYLKDVYLHDYDLRKLKKRKPNQNDIEIVEGFYNDILRLKTEGFEEIIRLFRGEQSCFDTVEVFGSKEIWRLLISFYSQIEEEISFIDYFWTWRGTHLPLMQIVTAEIPRAKIYHAISTGYAGLIGSVARVSNPSRFLLTEHGIYTHERMLEISQANWIYEKTKVDFRVQRELSFFKKWWITIFQIMSRLTYRYADKIFTLYEGNKLRQQIEGAEESKIEIIPNGIDVKSFTEIKREKKEKTQIGLIGRVVPIKDIKTYILSAQAVLEQHQECAFYIIGPTDEEEEYYEECRRLIESLSLEEKIVFTGRVDVKEYYRFLDIVVLTSASEAQPYVILEANIVGVPVVATNVGACHEMLNGRLLEDRLLGPSGIITDVADPKDTAQAIIRLIEDHHFYDQCAQAGVKRVKQNYDQDDLLSSYVNVYEQSM